MWWRRLLPCALALILLAAAPAAAAVYALQEGTEEAPETGVQETEGEEIEAADPESARKAERKVRRRAERKAKRVEAEEGEDAADPADTEDAEDAGVAPSGAADPAGSTSDSESATDALPDSDSDSDSDSDRPGRVVIETDARTIVYIDGRPAGIAEPGVPLEIGVELGEIELRFTAVELRSAVWETTLSMEEPGVETVRVRMLRTMRQARREERQEGIFRDSKSRLMWPRKDNGFNVDLRRAYAYCRDLGTGGLDGWRLPTLEELESLQSIWSRGIYKIRGDIELTECCIWTSEYDGTERAWTFNYRFRQPFQINAGYELGLRALCVREWPPESEEDEEAAAAEKKKGKKKG